LNYKITTLIIKLSHHIPALDGGPQASGPRGICHSAQFSGRLDIGQSSTKDAVTAAESLWWVTRVVQLKSVNQPKFTKFWHLSHQPT